jgi:hypothetical protein
MLMAPLWIGAAAVTQEAAVTFFAILSAAMLNGFLLFLLAQSAMYLREGAIGRALLLILLFPVQIAYSLAVVPHIAQGVLKGFRYAVNTFIITPKQMERTGLARVIVQQRLALLMALWLIISAILIVALQPIGSIRFIVPPLVFAVLTVIGVFLVPVSERLRNLLTRRRRPVAAVGGRRGKIESYRGQD